MQDYYIGLDVGTDSVGWAVTDTDYNILRKRGKKAWGIHLFDESNTAVERRFFRTSRRRLERRKERLNLLELLFDEEISKIDPAFFQRLKESNLYPEDKNFKTPYSVFSDKEFTDRDYHNRYPTIYHLRNELLESNDPHDIRLVYLALHHIIKNRGHFLFDSLDSEEVQNFDTVFQSMVSYINDNYLTDEDNKLFCRETEEVSNVLKDSMLTVTKKKDLIVELFGVTKKNNPQAFAMLALLSGAKVNLSDIYADEELKNAETKNVCFGSGFDDKQAEYESLLGERYELLEMIKAVYDWSVLADIMHGKQYISQAKVETFNQHKDDLALLKSYVKTYCPEKFNLVFREQKEQCDNYCAYTGHCKISGKKKPIKSCNQEKFCEFLKKSIKQNDDPKYSDMWARIQLKTFMPKQVTAGNTVIPMQLHLAELKKILANAESYLPCLTQKDEIGMSVSEKIIKIFEFRIPYYVGPLNPNSPKAWLVRSNEKIYPWNFEQVVDTEKSAEKFIENLTSKCSYLTDCDVIPKNSVLYSKYCVLNELNNLKINSLPISVELKQRIFNDLFLKRSKVTAAALKRYLTSLGYNDFEISGIDGDFKSSMKSYLDLCKFNLSMTEMDCAVKAITIFGDDKKLLKKRLKDQLGNKLSEDDIRKIASLKYSGWGNLSKEFLTEVESVNKKTGEMLNIISALWETNENLMQLLYSDDFDFNAKIKELNKSQGSKTLKEAVNELYVSPKVKRPIYRAMLIVEEIVKIMGYPPKKIFVEVAKGPTKDQKKGRKESRKDKLLELYKSCQKQSKEFAELYKSLQEKTNADLQSNKLFLYYTQMGKCMYSGKPINLDNLMSENGNYDKDHIFPKSKIKDDSILNNLILVDSTINQGTKEDIYPISKEIRDKMSEHWRFLYKCGFITQEKYLRLTRSTPLTDDELSAFISRQIVETRQSTKAIAKLLEETYGKSTEIVYVKASLVSDFRHDNDMLKSREVNDLHHAKDAYLNIVVGNVYNVKFTHDKANFIKGLQRNGRENPSISAMFDWDTPGAWKSKGVSMKIVKQTMARNDILYTRYAYKQSGGLFDQNPSKKGLAQVPLKENSTVSDTSKYGGYANPSAKYFCYVEHSGKKGKKIRTLVAIDAYAEKDFKKDPIGFLSQVKGLNEPKILIPCVKCNACISIDGFRRYVSSKSNQGETIVYKPGIQLSLSYDLEKYIKCIGKYISKSSDRAIDGFDHITKEKNILLYDALTKKLTETIFSKAFGKLGKKLLSSRERFAALTPEEQCYVLMEILKIIHSNVMTGDLRLIGRAKTAGALTSNSSLSEVKNVKSIKLIDQSVTGLFEKETDLLK